MGDAEEGSSEGESPDDQRRTGQRGFLSRIIGALSPQDNETVAAPAVNGNHAAPLSLPGLGNLRRLRVEDVMIPKAEIVSVPLDVKKDALVKVFSDSGLTRLPVYEGTLDTPVGLIHLKDFALMHGFTGRARPAFALKEMLRPLLFVPPSMPLGVLLQKMQAERMHMALVIDEYGGVDGLVTIEDLIEQVVGEIEDEHDVAEDPSFVQEKPGVYFAKSTTPLDEFELEVGRKLADAEDEEEIDTLGGLVFMLAGHVPARGEVVLHPDGHEFEVVEADPRRIKRLRVRMKTPDNAIQ
ncbi:hemolysin family protein [Frigidibacter sp. ROC022]|uniref:hemolysin family protein n=1 Tax=Frigidibacter sp. ROC022 TaxID=2971796 RepID=UPI00215B39F5|nr:hemolysin family protein [Frigidibacter sp. ROC022]MCR8722818.1 hemolysin family protein [Frigidibacter sp. ROC022]